MNQMIFIVGSRSIGDYDYVERHLNEYLSKIDDELVFVVGDQSGVDFLARTYAKKHGIKCIMHKIVDDRTLSIMIGSMIAECAENSSYQLPIKMIAFYDGKSKNTLRAIEKAYERDLDITVYRHDHEFEAYARGYEEGYQDGYANGFDAGYEKREYQEEIPANPGGTE